LSGDENVAQLLDRFVRAWESANIAELVALSKGCGLHDAACHDLIQEH
jgi:hypothetical protein